MKAVDLPVALNRGPAWILQVFFLWRAGKEKNETDGFTRRADVWRMHSLKRSFGSMIGGLSLSERVQPDDPDNPIKHCLFLWLIQLPYSSHHQKMVLSLDVHLLIFLQLSFPLSPLCKLPIHVPDNNILSKKKLRREKDHFIHSRPNAYWLEFIGSFGFCLSHESLSSWSHSVAWRFFVYYMCLTQMEMIWETISIPVLLVPSLQVGAWPMVSIESMFVEFMLIAKLDCGSFLVNEHCHRQQHELAEYHVSVMFSSCDSKRPPPPCSFEESLAAFKSGKSAYQRLEGVCAW